MVDVGTTVHTHCEGKLSRARNRAPLMVAVTPVDEVAVIVRTDVEARRDVTRTETTSGSPKAAATAC